MNEDRGPGGWYNTSENREWYRQYSSKNVRSQPVQPAKPPKKHPALKVTMIVLCVIVLIAATALAFSGGNSADDADEIWLPSFGGWNTLPDTGDGYDNYEDFFEDYFVDDDTQPSNIPRADSGTEASIALVSHEGMEKKSLQQIYADSIDSIVGITATVNGYDGYYWGTGIIIDENGYILTNAHVISGTDAAVVTLSDGTRYDALLAGEDIQSDLAVLKIEAEGLQSAQFGMSSELQVGEDVIAIGNPLGDELSGTMTNGIISAINRGMVVDGHEMTLLQTNAAINEGNSGGPLLNMYGQVIGVTNMKMVADFASATIEGIGFAIPSSTVKTIADQLISTGKVSGRPGLGITVGAVPQSAIDEYGLTQGLYISEIAKNSDAYKQGVRKGDILTAFNGQEVYTTDDVNLAKDGFAVGDTVTLSIFRNGRRFEVEVRLMDMDELY